MENIQVVENKPTPLAIELTEHRIRALECFTLLQKLALHQTTTTYEALAISLGLPSRGNALGQALSPILYAVLDWCVRNSWPNLTVLVVRKSGSERGLPGAGFWGGLGYDKMTLAEKHALTKKWTGECFTFFNDFAV